MFKVLKWAIGIVLASALWQFGKTGKLGRGGELLLFFPVLFVLSIIYAIAYGLQALGI